MENMQVYRVRFGGSSKLMIEADLRRGAAAIDACGSSLWISIFSPTPDPDRLAIFAQ